MIVELLSRVADGAAEGDLRELVAGHVRVLRASERGGDRGLVSRAEDVVRADPSAFSSGSSGVATLTAAGWTWSAGRFEIPSIGELRARVSAGDGEARLWVLDGASPATDIGALQATTDGSPLFQVASQFNCLEAPGPRVVPVASYFSDPTQGPRAAISAFPATLLRHYAGPGKDGEPFVQETDGRQIDLLADVFAPDRSPVRNGYLLDDGGIGRDAVAAALEERFERVRIGVHYESSVVLGYNWDGAVDDADRRRIAQTLTSTVAGTYGGRAALGPNFDAVCRQLLRAAYLGTLLAAISLRRSPVVLTLIGGGVFGNPLRLIWDSILWALDEAKPQGPEPFEVIVNGRNLHEGPELAGIIGDVRRRGGAVLRFDSTGLAAIRH